ncbi:MAG: hypothetical protein WEG56_04630 [Chloroflexota bacterium]
MADVADVPVTVSHEPVTTVQGCCADPTIRAVIRDQPCTIFHDP